MCKLLTLNGLLYVIKFIYKTWEKNKIKKTNRNIEIRAFDVVCYIIWFQVRYILSI